jgi:hypothetical protein
MDEQAHRFLHYLKGLSAEEALRKAAVLSKDQFVEVSMTGETF